MPAGFRNIMNSNVEKRRLKLQALTLIVVALAGYCSIKPEVSKNLPVHEALPSTKALHSQGFIEGRLIFIGDAGLARAGQPIWKDLENSIRESKQPVTTVFLGDNVYEAGLPEKSERDPLFPAYFEVLRTQVEAARGSVETIFVAGNHDWKNGEPQGKSRILEQERQLVGMGARFFPGGGCPDITMKNVTPGVSVMFLDSQAIIFLLGDRKYSLKNCRVKSVDELKTQVNKVLKDFNNSERILILAMHHPLATNGSHGGHFGWQHHVFPVYNYNKYFPLPGIASLAVWSRQSGVATPADTAHTEYHNFIVFMNEALSEVKNLLVASGHDHNLQLLKLAKKNHYQVVSGSGSKSDPVDVDIDSMEVSEKNGYVIVDIMNDSRMVLHMRVMQEAERVLVLNFNR